MTGRLVVLGAMALALLPVAGAASTAASAPPGRIVALNFHNKTGTGVAFDIESSRAAAAVAKATVYVPAGYGLDLSRAPGSTVGEAYGILATPDGDFASLGQGAITTGDPATLPGDPAAQACAPGAHAAFWIVSDTLASQPAPLRFYVDPTSGAETSLGAFKLVVCFDSPYVTGALRLIDFQVGLFGPGGSVFTPPASGTFAWRMFVTPYASGTGSPDPAATFEARTRVLLPHVLTEHVRYRAKSQKLFVSGRLTALGRPRRGVFVSIAAGPRNDDLSLIGRVRTRANGSYAFVRRLREGRRAQKLEIWVFRNEPASACGEASVAPAGCVDESLSGPQAHFMRLTIPKLRKR
jgi:hypothetical protein